MPPGNQIHIRGHHRHVDAPLTHCMEELVVSPQKSAVLESDLNPAVRVLIHQFGKKLDRLVPGLLRPGATSSPAVLRLSRVSQGGHDNPSQEDHRCQADPHASLPRASRCHVALLFHDGGMPTSTRRIRDPPPLHPNRLGTNHVRTETDASPRRRTPSWHRSRNRFPSGIPAPQISSSADIRGHKTNGLFRRSVVPGKPGRRGAATQSLERHPHPGSSGSRRAGGVPQDRNRDVFNLS